MPSAVTGEAPPLLDELIVRVLSTGPSPENPRASAKL
jgi:hypothetical protein